VLRLCMAFPRECLIIVLPPGTSMICVIIVIIFTNRIYFKLNGDDMTPTSPLLMWHAGASLYDAIAFAPANPRVCVCGLSNFSQQQTALCKASRERGESLFCSVS